MTLLSKGTHNLVAAMQAQGVGRLVCITGIGAGESKGHGPMKVRAVKCEP